MVKLEHAPKRTASRRMALILGDQGIGEQIGSGLREMGYETEIRPAPPLNSTADDLRALLREFARSQAAWGGDLWVHPGVTPVAERNEWPVIAREAGMVFIGPPARSLSLFNNRLSLLSEAEKIGISNLLLSPDPLHSAREIERLIRTNRFKLPFVLKAVRGGSGFGVRVVHQPEDLGRSLGLWLEQIRRSLGDVIILAERYLEGSRRIVQPFVRFLDGTVELFPMVDASLTSRLRKVAEFCPAELAVTSEGSETELKTLRDWTAALAARAGYVGVGSLEYLVDGARCYLIEGVPRLNTSFKSWEKVAGTSAVAWQLAAQSGADGARPTRAKGCKASLSLRFQAEDPILQLPQPGKVIELGEKTEWNFPGARAELHLAVRAGEELLPSDPGVVGYLRVDAEDRKRAITVARGVLEEVWIAGSLQTNERFLQELMTHPWVQEGMFHASFVDEEFIPSIRPDPELLQAFVAMARLICEDGAGAREAKWAVGDQWIRGDAPPGFSWVIEPAYLREGKGESAGNGAKTAVHGVLRTSRGQTLRAFCYPVAEDRWQGRVGNWFLPVRRVLPGPKGKSAPIPRLTALVSGRVHSLFFRQGAWVPAHEPVLLIESLSTLVPHALPMDMRLARWLVSAEDRVQAGMPLAEFERAPPIS